VLNSRLSQHGFSSHLISGTIDPREGTIPIEADLAHSQVPVLRKGINPFRDLRAAFKIYREIKRISPAIVHTHLAKAGALGRMSALAAGVPVTVHTFHGHVLSGYFPSSVSRLMVFFEKQIARRTNALIAVSAVVRDELLALGIGNAEKWHVIPLGLELDYLLHDRPTKREARIALKLPGSGPIIGLVGRLVPIKDVETFLKACKLVAEREPNASFVVAGDGPLRTSLEEQASRLVGNKVQFLGWVDDLANLYAALDIVALTSLNEGTPVSLIEASAAGCALVGTRVGGVPDVILHEQTGFLVPPRDPYAVAEKICCLLSSSKLAEQMGRTGSAHVSTKFSAERLVSDVASLYGSLLRS
jgi:glycosyltransferase involved in cell wall biosynthesis